MDIIGAATTAAKIGQKLAPNDENALAFATVHAAQMMSEWIERGGNDNIGDQLAANALISAGFSLLSAAVIQGGDLAAGLADLLAQVEEWSGHAYLTEGERRAVAEAREARASAPAPTAREILAGVVSANPFPTGRAA